MKKTSRSQWVLGIDPGYGHTGAVLRRVDDPQPTAWACWSNDSTQEWPTLRAMSIAFPLIETVIGWILEHQIEDLDVCIEYPVYNRNARALMTQMSLYDMINAYCYDYLRPHLTRLWLTEVNPKTSKSKLAHDGQATKAMMIAASPWAKYKDFGLTLVQAHTLADSYAHSLSAEVREHRLHAMDQYAVSPTTVFPVGMCHHDEDPSDNGAE